MHLYFRVLLCGAGVFVTSCSALDVLGLGDGHPPNVTGAPIRTDSAVYHVRTGEHAHELTIGLTYTNRTGGTVYIPTCHSPHPPVLQKWEDGKWATAFSPVILLCLGPPVVIEPGRRYTYSYHVYAAHRPNSAPRFEVAEIPGTYRLLWTALGTGHGREIALEERVSNSFEIRR